MSIPFPSTELPTGLRGGSDTWDDGPAGVVLVDDFFQVEVGGDVVYQLTTSSFSFVTAATQNTIRLEPSTAVFQRSSFAISNNLALSFTVASLSYLGRGIDTLTTLGLGVRSFTLSPQAIDYSIATGITYDLTSASFQIVRYDISNALSLALTTSDLDATAFSLNTLQDKNIDFTAPLFRMRGTSINVPVALSSGLNVSDIIYYKLKENNYEGSLPDMLLDFFNGDQSVSLVDAERNWLITQSGVDEGSNADLWEIYLTSLGYEGSLEDKIKNFWLNY